MRRSQVNPEAGDVHAPDQADVRAAVEHAVALTWRANPYYYLRFGERGWRFSLSDSGWMATLPEYGPARAQQQLRWLHRVLANRGMPGILLEEHLLVMHRVLSRRLPDRAAEWAIFSDGSEALAQSRAAVLSDAALEARAAAFAAAAGAPEHRLFLGAGRLLAGAWADEQLGMPKAVPSLLAWLANRDALPDHFCDAAEAAVGL